MTNNTRKYYIPSCVIGVFLIGISWFVTPSVVGNDTTLDEYEIISRRDTLVTHDSIIVIHTVCAPICSSHARVYNMEWQEIGVLKAPFKSVFPEAYIEDGKLLWRDNDNYDYDPVL